MLLPLALAGIQAIIPAPATAVQVRWHLRDDKTDVVVYHLPCPRPAKGTILPCHWSVPETPLGVSAFIAEHRLARYSVAFADLNGDDQPEALIYAVATAGAGQADLCGSGGCDLYVLSLTSTGYREVGRVSITRPPIRILPTLNNGWHDLGVEVAGGGITSAYQARLRFDGHEYPSNPSVPPATRLVAVTGVTAIDTIPSAP